MIPTEKNLTGLTVTVGYVLHSITSLRVCHLSIAGEVTGSGGEVGINERNQSEAAASGLGTWSPSAGRSSLTIA